MNSVFVSLLKSEPFLEKDDYLLNVASDAYINNFFSNGRFYKYSIPYVNKGVSPGYDKTKAYTYYSVWEKLTDKQKNLSISSIKTTLNTREVNASNLFNTILLSQVLDAVDETEISSKLVHCFLQLPSEVLHVELFRLAACLKFKSDCVPKEIENLMMKLGDCNVYQLQKVNAFYGKADGANEHELSYLCIGLLDLYYHTKRCDCRTALKRVFEDIHTRFIRSKTITLDRSKHASNSASALMSCFFLAYYMLFDDVRSLNAACYLLERLDNELSRRTVLGETSSKVGFLTYHKSPSWLLAYYIVAKKLKAVSLDKFSQSVFDRV